MVSPNDKNIAKKPHIGHKKPSENLSPNVIATRPPITFKAYK